MPDKNKFYKIWSGDYSDEGYSDGFKDGKEVKPKNKLKFFSSSNPVNWFWAFDRAFGSYSENYDVGYVDAEKVRHEVYYPLNSQKEVKIMSNNGGHISSYSGLDDYKRHLQMLERVKQNIYALKRYLGIMQEKYKQQIDKAETMGFMQNYTDELKKRYKIFYDKIEGLIILIEKHTRQISEQENIIRKLMEDAKG
jgi:hypothetical protein